MNSNFTMHMGSVTQKFVLDITAWYSLLNYMWASLRRFQFLGPEIIWWILDSHFSN